MGAGVAQNLFLIDLKEGDPLLKTSILNPRKSYKFFLQAFACGSLLFSSASLWALKNGTESIVLKADKLIPSCERQGIAFPDLENQDLQDNLVCNLVSPEGKIFSEGDDHYKLVVDYVNSKSEDTWDDLYIAYNQSRMDFVTKGEPGQSVDVLLILQDAKTHKPYALIAQRSFGVDQKWHYVRPHYFVFQLNKEQSTLIQAKGKDAFPNSVAFKDYRRALQRAENLPRP